MRYLLLIVAIALGLTAFSQTPRPTTLPSPNSTGYAKWGYVRGDSAFLLGLRGDTTWVPITSALSAVKFAGRDTSILYFYDGVKWKPAGASAGGGSTVDSFFYQLRQLNDTTVLFDRGDGVVDTLAISGSGGGGGSGLNKVDSVTTVGDSLFYWINGDSFFSANLALSVVDGDTSALSVVDSTGQPARRVLFSAPNNKISSTKFFLYDTVNNKLVIGTPIISAGTGSKLFVNGNASFQGNVIADTGYFNRVGLVTRTITFNADSMRVNGLDQVADTSRFKPQVYDPINKTWSYFDRWPVTPSIDTTSLSNRINLKLNISDTAAMLSPYLKVADTVGTGSLYIRNQFVTQENKKFSIIQGKVDALDFNATSSIADSTQRLTWDDGNGTLNIGLKGGQVNLAVGQEQVARVYNDAGVTLNDGDIVYITGAQGNRIKVQKAVNTDAAIAYATLGMVTEPIAAGSEGFVTILGTVNHLNTSSFTEGTELYLSGTAGGYTSTKPAYPAAIVSIGRVERSHATVGSIYVNVRPELPTVASYGKNAGGDSTILLMSNGQRFAAKDSAGGGGGGITIDSVAVRRIPQGTFNHYVGFNSGVGGTGTSGGNVTTDNVQAGENLVMFKDAGFSFRTTGRFDGNNTLIGTSSGKWVTNQAFLIGIGFQTIGGANASIADSLWTTTSAGGHIGIGYQALARIKGNDGQSSNVAIGTRAMDAYTGCGGCTSAQVAIGTDALGGLTTGVRNSAVGANTLSAGTTFTDNTAFGFSALGSATGSSNTAMGSQALSSLGGGTRNQAFGFNSGYGVSGSASDNTLIGWQIQGGSGSRQVALGSGTNAGTSGSDNIAIGASIGVLSSTASNQFSLGSNSVRWLISDVSGSSRRWTFNGTTSDITATEASAALEVRSTSGGLLVPRMTATQASAIGTPADGNILYVTDTNATFTSVGFWGRENGAWVKL